jgi:hypothetical protein
MPHITTVVYLNDRDGNFLGFNTFAPAQLREARNRLGLPQCRLDTA